MNKWDEKAKNYSRYTEGDDRFEAKILQALKSLHVSFEAKSILDIGCGTGVYTLRIAKVASHVDALDSSAGMLEVLKEDAKKLGIKNISTKLTSWEDFKITGDKYDIAICTMSPAVSSASHFEKMTQCAKTKIYLGWAGKRSSNILERLVEVHNATYTHPNGAKQLCDWLDIEKKSYQVLPFDEQRLTQKEFKKALQNFKWHLEIRGITPDVDKIKKVLENFCDKDGLITENMANHMNLIVW
jgi:SAM-dependent methyltransferase